MRRDGKPDTRNTACMNDCVKEVRLSSEMPDYARDQHGNLAEQGRGVGDRGARRAASGRREVAGSTSPRRRPARPATG